MNSNKEAKETGYRFYKQDKFPLVILVLVILSMLSVLGLAIFLE